MTADAFSPVTVPISQNAKARLTVFIRSLPVKVEPKLLSVTATIPRLKSAPALSRAPFASHSPGATCGGISGRASSQKRTASPEGGLLPWQEFKDLLIADKDPGFQVLVRLLPVCRNRKISSVCQPTRYPKRLRMVHEEGQLNHARLSGAASIASQRFFFPRPWLGCRSPVASSHLGNWFPTMSKSLHGIQPCKRLSCPACFLTEHQPNMMVTGFSKVTMT
ncbi:hypothetical protein BJ166DRAFT_510257 [Pestalotiopsis sp. NC0098]|nr:hypothetical protein BJ166DRAFT_510257 [Pestalotiopsis sp. NC0098]